VCSMCYQETIKPTSRFVTRWQTDQHAAMSYSYVPVGCTADAYEQIAKPVNNRIFFAGEVNFLPFYLRLTVKSSVFQYGI